MTLLEVLRVEYLALFLYYEGMLHLLEFDFLFNKYIHIIHRKPHCPYLVAYDRMSVMELQEFSGGCYKRSQRRYAGHRLSSFLYTELNRPFSFVLPEKPLQ